MAKILVVDDEPTLVHTIGYNLRRDGHEVLTAGNGVRALDLARREGAQYAERLVRYRAPAAVCTACPAKAACTPGTTGCHVHRSLHEAYLGRVRAYHAAE